LEFCRAIQTLAKKVAELEAGLTALLSGQAIPPAAAAALIAAISRMGRSSGELAQTLSKPGSRAGAASRGGKSSSGNSNSRGPSEGAAAAISAGGMRVPGKGDEGKLTGMTVQQAAEELDSVIQTINQVSLRL
jgi:hypothetical protein